MAILENFSVPKGDTLEVKFDLTESEEAISLHAAQAITWKVYKQLHGVTEDDPIISKDLNDGIVAVESPVGFNVDLQAEDTDIALGSYFHEAKVTDSQGDIITVTQGLMTITEAK